MRYTDDIQIPLLSKEMKSGILTQWCVSDGERVEMGDVIYELDTGEEVYQIENFQSGIVRISGKIGKTYPVGEVVGFIEFTEEDRREIYYLGISLDHQQRSALERLCGDVDPVLWMRREFTNYIKSRLKAGE